MEQSKEISDLISRFYGSMENGDIAYIDNLLSHKAEALAIGTDPQEWWAGYDTIGPVFKAQIKEMAGIKGEALETNAYREGTVGWGSSQLVMRLPNGKTLPMRSTAVFHQENGSWKMIQFHLSIGVPNEEAFGGGLTV